MSPEEGYVKYRCHWHDRALPEQEEEAGLLRLRQRMYERRLVGFDSEQSVGFGNVSHRVQHSEQFLITGTQTGKYPDLARHHLSLVTRVDPARNELFCVGLTAASSEAMTHAAVYAVCPSARVVIHAHHATAWQALGGRYPTTSESVPYGTPEMGREVARLIQHKALSSAGFLVMGGHEEGLLAWGRSVPEAEEMMLAPLASFLV